MSARMEQSISKPPATLLVDANGEDEIKEEEADTGFADEFIDVSDVKYRQGTGDNDQLVLVLNAASGQCKEKYRTQLWNLFFAYVSCVICSNIVLTEPKARESELFKKAYILFVGLDTHGYASILRGGHGLFAAFTEPKMPEFVVSQAKDFIANPILPKGSKTSGDNETEKGKIIWRLFQKMKTYVVNVANIHVRDIKSGENKTGVLLEIREKLWIIEVARKRTTRLTRDASSKCGKGTMLRMQRFVSFECQF